MATMTNAVSISEQYRHIIPKNFTPAYDRQWKHIGWTPPRKIGYFRRIWEVIQYA